MNIINPYALPTFFIKSAAGKVASVINVNCKVIGNVANPNGKLNISTIGAKAAPIKVVTEKISTI